MTDCAKLSCFETKRIASTFTLLSGVDSTNNYIKNLSDILPDGHLCLAREQMSGRGRQQKSFYSPCDNGLYMSVLVKDIKTVNSDLLTARVCLSVCRAVEKLVKAKTKLDIKWVNDIYCNGKKLAGILCERRAVTADEAFVVIGIGVNLKIDRNVLPRELKNIVTSINDAFKVQCDAITLATYICKELEKELYENDDVDKSLCEYRQRSIVLGREITVVRDGVFEKAMALDVLFDGALLVRYQDGKECALCGGEISIKLKK